MLPYWYRNAREERKKNLTGLANWQIRKIDAKLNRGLYEK
jgi:hypothetical protein